MKDFKIMKQDEKVEKGAETIKKWRKNHKIMKKWENGEKPTIILKSSNYFENV